MKETGLNFQNWSDFFKNIPFTFFRTSQIQKKYIQTILDYAPKKNAKLLEIAGGSGYTAAVVADLVRNDGGVVTYSDLDPVLVEDVSKRFSSISNLKFAVADAFNLPYKDGEFDIGLSQGVEEHFNDDDIVKMLKERARVVKYVIFDIPNSRRWNKIQEFGNERFLSHKKWLSLVEKSELTVYYHTARRFTNPWKKWVPVFIQDTEWFHKHFGEASIIVCGRAHI